MGSINIRRLFTFLTVGFSLLLIILIVTFFRVKMQSEKISDSYRNQFQSYLLADELRQSSDDLTRLGRLYVITGEQTYKDQYNAVLDIRNGKKPRPEDYHRIYWDFVAGGVEKPRPDGSTVSLTDLMVESGFTDEEFAYLKKANDNSDGLVNLEVEAMNIVDGKFKDSRGNYTVERQPTEQELARAAELVHGPSYHKFKSEIMKPVDKFYVALEDRTEATIQVAVNSTRRWSIIVFVVLAFFTVFLIFAGRIMRQRVLNPIRELQAAMVQIAGNHLEQKAPFTDRQDEIGEMGRALENFRQSILEGERLRAEVDQKNREDIEQQHKIAEEKERKSQYINKLIAEFGQDITENLELLSGAADELQATATSMTGIAETTDDRAGDAATASTSASENVDVVASATEELSACINEIEKQVQLSADETAKATTSADKASKQMLELEAASNTISQVLGLINGIAGQTNLLALNATIEAAGAGEAGRGFSVVANEIKVLATQTAAATKDISAQIDSVQTAAQNSIEGMRAVTQILENAKAMVSGVVTAIQEQRIATDEIAVNIQEASTRNQRVSENIKDIATKVTETRGASNQVLSASNDVSSSSFKLKEVVGGFLTKIKSMAADAGAA